MGDKESTGQCMGLTLLNVCLSPWIIQTIPIFYLKKFLDDHGSVAHSWDDSTQVMP